MYVDVDEFLRLTIANSPFPPVTKAFEEPDGFLSHGGELSVEYLVAAYAHGIFPWFNPGQTILWWAPSQRMVLNYKHLKISHSLRKTLKKIQRQAHSQADYLRLNSHTNSPYEIRLDTAFERVMRACAEPRAQEKGTWISEEFIHAYGELHDMGLAHSFETWCNGELVGGLYGVSLGKMFFGESMFSRQADASKIALVFAANYLADQGIYTIDCQQDTPHLRRMGADLMPRADFTNLLERTILKEPIVWRKGPINPGILLL